MRWVSVGAAVLGFVVFLAAKTPGLMGLGLLLGFGGLFFAVFAFAAARIASTARPDSMMLTDKDINALKASLRKPNSAAAATPPSADSGIS